MDEHLDLPELDQLLTLKADWTLLYEWLFHLMLCGECRKRLLILSPEGGERLLRRVFKEVEPLSLVPREEQDAPAFHHFLTSLHKRGEELMREALETPALVSELLAHPQERRMLLVTNSRRFANFTLGYSLLELARDRWHDDPAEAQALAELSVEIAARLDPTHYPPEIISDLKGAAWAHMANIQRIVSDFREAERTFQRAIEYLQVGTGDGNEWSRVLSFLGSLRRDQRRLGEASALLEGSAMLARQVGDLQGEAKAVLQHASVLAEGGALEDAIAALEALHERRKPEDLGSRLYWVLLHDLTTAFAQAGRYESAAALLPTVRKAALELGDRLNVVRVRWVEGMVAAGFDDTATAEEAFVSVRDAFLEAGIGYDAALASLDLALLHLRRGNLAAARGLAEEMLPIFMSRDVDREAASALLILVDALRREAATVQLVEKVARYLKGSRPSTPPRFRDPS